MTKNSEEASTKKSRKEFLDEEDIHQLNQKPLTPQRGPKGNGPPMQVYTDYA